MRDGAGVFHEFDGGIDSEKMKKARERERERERERDVSERVCVCDSWP